MITVASIGALVSVTGIAQAQADLVEVGQKASVAQEALTGVAEAATQAGEAGGAIVAGLTEAGDAAAATGNDSSEAAAAFAHLAESAAATGDSMGAASAGMREAGMAAQEAGAQASEGAGGFKGFVGQMLSMAGGQIIFAGLAKAMSFVSAQIKDVGTQTNAWQAATTQLNTVLHSTGGVAGVTKQSAIDYADAMSKVTTFNNTSILSMENMGLTFTAIGKNIFPQTMNAVMDMTQAFDSGGKSMSLTNAMIQVGKAVQNPILGMTALRREGVDFSASQVAAVKAMVATGNTAEAQQIILHELAREFGGSAKAAGTTFAGAMAILGNHFDIVKQQLGQALIPTLEKLFVAISPLISAFAMEIPKALTLAGQFLGQIGKAFSTAFSQAAGAHGVATETASLGNVLSLVASIMQNIVVPAVVLMATVVGTLAGWVVKITNFFTQHAAAAEVLRDALLAAGAVIAGMLVASFIAWAVAAGAAAIATIAATWPIIAIIAAFTAVILVIKLVVTHWTQITAALTSFKAELGVVAGDVGAFCGTVLGAIGGLAGGILGWFEALPSQVAKAIGQMMQAVVNAVKSGAGAVGQAVSNIPVLGGLASGEVNAAGSILSHLPHFAAGGTSAGGLSLVGEAGPEVVSLPAGSRVHPHGSGFGGGGAAGGRTTQTIILQLNGRTLAKEVVSNMPSVIRLGTGARTGGS